MPERSCSFPVQIVRDCPDGQSLQRQLWALSVLPEAAVRYKQMKQFLAAMLTLSLGTAFLTGCGGSAASGVQSEAQEVSPSEAASAAEESAVAIQAQELTADPLTGFELEWQGQRPVAVMINGDTSEQNPWGVSAASVMIEAVTTGQDTSLMCLYPAVDAVEQAGPVSAGDDVFLQLVLPLNAIPVQISKTIYAGNLLNTLGVQDLDGYYTGTTCFDYDSERGAAADNEYCWYTNAGLLKSGLELYGLSAEGETRSIFQFGKDQRQDPDIVTAQQVKIRYGANDEVTLHYDSFSGRYLRTGADGADMTDAVNGETVKFRNVFLLTVQTGVKDDNATRDYDLSSGDGLYLTQGGWEKVTWRKGDVLEPLMIYAADGSELVVNPGPSYIGLLSSFNGQNAVILDADGNEQMQ